jgi:hypothetical protein
VAKDPQPWRDLADEIRKVREAIESIRAASPFANAGFHPTADDGIESDNFDGDLNAADAGTRGWAMDADQAAFGELILRPGIIGNDALTDPVIPGSVWQSDTGFSVAVAWSTVVTRTVTVPDGCTRLEADARARVTAFYNNVGTGIDYLYAHLTVGGQSSGYYPLAVTDNGGSGTNHVFRNVLLTGLTPGASVTFALQASTGFFSWAGPTTNNEAQIGASLRWLR